MAKRLGHLGLLWRRLSTLVPRLRRDACPTLQEELVEAILCTVPQPTSQWRVYSLLAACAERTADIELARAELRAGRLPQQPHSFDVLKDAHLFFLLEEAMPLAEPRRVIVE